MFKIVSVSLDDYDAYTFYDNYTLIYGGNNTGKSALFKIIYYMLGSDVGWDGKTIWELDGLDNISYITMVVNNGYDLYLKRNKNGNLYYKRSKEDMYIKINLNLYKEYIQSMIITNIDCFDLYRNSVGENLNYRGFAYLNFIDQYGLGNAFQIFKQFTDVKYAKRIKKQMQFIFDNVNQKRLFDLEKKKNDIEKIVNRNNENIFRKKILVDQINDLMDYLEIKNPLNVEEKIQNFNAFCENRLEKVDPINKEFIYLLKVSNQLENQIQIEKTFFKQNNFIKKRNEKSKLLLNLLKNSIGSYPEFNKYLISINESLKYINYENDIFSLNNYGESIKNLETKKIEVDKLIAKYKNSITNKSEAEISNSIKALKYYFKKYNDLNIDLESSKADDEIKKIELEMLSIKNRFNHLYSEEFNHNISDLYLNMPSNISFVKEDIEKGNNFKLKFIPSKAEIVGKKEYTAYINGKNVIRYMDFIPGSKARQTCWQIITFIGLFVYIHKTFPSFPLLPILVIDGISEPFDENFAEIFTYLTKICNEASIQLICTSTKIVGNQLIDLSSGLNSKH